MNNEVSPWNQAGEYMIGENPDNPFEIKQEISSLADIEENFKEDITLLVTAMVEAYRAHNESKAYHQVGHLVQEVILEYSLKQCDDNKTKAAEYVGMARGTTRNYLINKKVRLEARGISSGNL